MNSGNRVPRTTGVDSNMLPMPRIGIIATGGSIGRSSALASEYARSLTNPLSRPIQRLTSSGPGRITELRAALLREEQCNKQVEDSNNDFLVQRTPETFGRKRLRPDSAPENLDTNRENRSQSGSDILGFKQMGKPKDVKQRTKSSELLRLLNRTLQSVKLGRWEEALVEAIGPTFSQKGGAKWKFAIGMYILEIKTYEECQGDIEQIRVSALEKQSTAKRYRGLRSSTSEKFVGPLKIGISEGRGRGIFTTRQVQQGELLMISEPLAVVDADPSQFNTIGVLSSSLLEEISSVVKSRPFELPRLFALDDGACWNKKVPHISLFSDDTVAIAEVNDQETNWPESFAHQHTRLEKVINLNRIQNLHDGGGSYIQRSTGLYMLPSMINHSCIPNASQVFMGNTLIITAARAIAMGEEITIQYFDVLTNLEERRRMCSDRFVCNCERCKFEERIDCLAEMFISHTIISISPLWQQVTSPDNTTAERAAKNQDNRTIAIQAVFTMNKFISGLTFPTEQKNWLHASLFKVTETVLRCFLSMDSVDRLTLKLLESLTSVIGRICPFSIYHVIWVRQGLLAAVELTGKDSEYANNWRKSLDQLGQMRYKNIPSWVFEA